MSNSTAQRHETKVLVVGAGPAGLITALQLARQGTKCMLVERNLDTTRWPKMDITNCRSMELFNRLGISQGLREQGVGQDFSFDVIFSTGLGRGGEVMGKWSLPSPNEWRRRIRSQNDGSMPREPYQRCSQAIFEAWLKPQIQRESLIGSHFGLKFESLTESGTGVESTLVNLATGATHVIHSDYVIGCDGGGSRVRRSIGGVLMGGPVPMAMFLIHFKSRDLRVLQSQGQFWHIFFSHGGAIISQDEDDTWTVHTPVGIDVDPTTLDAEKAVADALGGHIGTCPIVIDKILVQSVWRPNIYIVDRYISTGGRVFLAGDAAHQNIPTGGYGMNTAVGDSFDIGWKIAAVINGYGGEHLLESYETERRPVAVRNIERSGVHFSVHRSYLDLVAQHGGETVIAKTEEGMKLRSAVDKILQEHDGENQEHGIEMGYRYNGSPVIIADLNLPEPEWNFRDYLPSTWPGARAPHVWLEDGKRSIYDLFGPGFTIVDFTINGKIAERFATAAFKFNVPLTKVHVPCEHHARKIWERDAVLIRPDDHVAWRSSADSGNAINAEEVLKIAIGLASAAKIGSNSTNGIANGVGKSPATGFSGTIGNVNHSDVQALGAFQR